MGLCHSCANEDFGYDVNRKDLDVSFKKGWYLTTVPVVAREKPDHESPVVQHIKKGTRIEMVAFTNWFVKISSPVHGYIQFVTVAECMKRQEPNGGAHGNRGTTQIIVQPGRLGLYFTDLTNGTLGNLNPNPQEILKIIGVKAKWKLIDVEGHPFRMDILKRYIDGSEPYHLKFEKGCPSYGDIRLAVSTDLDLVETSIQSMTSSRIESSERPVEVMETVAISPLSDIRRSISLEDPARMLAESFEIPTGTRSRNLSPMVDDYEKKIASPDYRKRTIESVPVILEISTTDKSDKKRHPSSVAEIEVDGDFFTIASEKITTTVTTTTTTTTKRQQKDSIIESNTIAPPAVITTEKKIVQEILPPSFIPPSFIGGDEKENECDDEGRTSDPMTEQRKKSRKSITKKVKPSEPCPLLHSEMWPQNIEGNTNLESQEQLGPIELGEPIPDTLTLYQIRRMKKVGRLLGDGFEPKRTHKRQVSETLQLLQQNGTLFTDE